ncbi:hypothetical protein SE17_16260 [Kouleothrix aurantiaca]|jgi:hypothetical protein|uniref:Uncharacterized protein n=1 Tax=Kouleothrix aurantiaca TaxID=186479 RepID=A0A0P9HCR0_9CHLR|nr:hypothetical protein SE17_16260 [Kouleothrix aurantiaca]
MNAILLIVGVAALLWLVRPVRRTRMILVPVEVSEARGGLGCLPLLLLLAAALVVVLVNGGFAR